MLEASIWKERGGNRALERDNRTASWARVLRKTDTMKYWWGNHPKVKKYIFFWLPFASQQLQHSSSCIHILAGLSILLWIICSPTQLRIVFGAQIHFEFKIPFLDVWGMLHLITAISVAIVEKRFRSHRIWISFQGCAKWRGNVGKSQSFGILNLWNRGKENLAPQRMMQILLLLCLLKY